MARSPSGRAAVATGHERAHGRARRCLAAVVAAALATAWWVVPVPAAAQSLVTWVATGSLDRVDLDLQPAGLEVGDPFTVRFTFDTSAADISTGDPTRGDYADLITSVEVEIDGGTDGIFGWTATPAATFLDSSSTVFDDWTGAAGDQDPRDQWWLQASEGWSGDTLNGYQIRFLQRFLNLFDGTATAFDSDALPTSPPDPAAFDSADFMLVFEDEDRFRQALAGPIETLTVDGGGDPVAVSVSEGAGVADTVEVTVGIEAGLAAAAGVRDRVRVTVGADVALRERAGVADTVTVAVETAAPVSEAAGVADTVTVTVAGDARVGETVGVADTVTVTVAADVGVGETAGVTDTVSVAVGTTVSEGTLLGTDGTEQTAFYSGDPVRLTGDGFAPDSSVDLELRSEPIPLGSTTADAAGAIDVTVELPPDTPPGEHTLVGVGVAPDGLAHEVRAAITVLDPSPEILGVGDPAPVEHSDGLVPVTVAFEDPNSPPAALTVTTTGLPAEVGASVSGCEEVGGTTRCTAELSGTVTAPAGTYAGAVTVADGAFTDTAPVTIVVTAETGRVRLSPANPASVTVDPDTGTSGRIVLDLHVEEADPDEGHEPGPVDLAQVAVAVVLEPLGPGSTVAADCDRVVRDDVLALSCAVDALPVGTYAVSARTGGARLAGADEDVLTVADPDLGFATGGGELLWPGTATPDCAGDRTSFGFTVEHNRPGTNVRGSFLLVRHTCDGGIIRVRSNALDGLAVGSTDGGAWASFSGKATFLAPWLDEEQGNHTFTVYVEDADQDRFWVEVRDKDGQIIEPASQRRPPTDHAVALTDGDIVVPTERRRGGPPGR